MLARNRVDGLPRKKINKVECWQDTREQTIKNAVSMLSAAVSWRVQPLMLRRGRLITAHSWEQLAAEIEGAQAFIRTMAEIVGRGEPGQPGQAEPEAA